MCKGVSHNYTAPGHMEPILTPQLKFDPHLGKTVLQRTC